MQDVLLSVQRGNSLHAFLCRSGKIRFLHDCGKLYEIVPLQGKCDALLLRLGEVHLAHHAADEVDLPEADLKILQPCRADALDSQGDDLGISRDGARADQLDTALIEFALPPRLRLLRAENVADISELQRQRLLPHAARDKTCDGRRHLVAQRQRPVVLSEEFEHLRFQAAPVSHRQGVKVLDGRRRDLIISPETEKPHERRFHLALFLRLLRHEIPRSVGNPKNPFIFGHLHPPLACFFLPFSAAFSPAQVRSRRRRNSGSA